jgi:hypothetical protein
METVTGIFNFIDDATRAVEGLRNIGISRENIDFLAPGESRREVHSEVPTTETEQPGMGKAIGGVVGAALGATLGIATASAFLPGVGWVVTGGLVAAALLGIGGATVGKAVEGGLFPGLPKDELFVYEDALRRGRVVIVALAADEEQAEKTRQVMNQSNAESIDAAREQWWVGLRDAEEAKYLADGGGDFRKDEQEFRQGFEAALGHNTRGREYLEVAVYLQERYPGLYEKDSFRRGYERGQSFYSSLNMINAEDFKREMPSSRRPATR